MDPELFRKKRAAAKQKKVMFEVVKINSSALKQIRALEQEGVLRRVRCSNG